DRLRAERLCDREAGSRDAAADSPEQHPFLGLETGSRHEHAVGRLEDERERGGLFEREVARNGVDVRRRDGNELRVRAVSVLADHVDRAVCGLDSGADDDGHRALEAVHAFAHGFDPARTVGAAAPAEPYVDTERHIRERRARGVFADMKFTMAQPERSCHPETLLPGARTVISAALCYYAPEPERPGGHGRLPRYTWADAYA